MLALREPDGGILAVAGYDGQRDSVIGWRRYGGGWRHVTAAVADVRGRYVDVDTPCRLSDL